VADDDDWFESAFSEGSGEDEESDESAEKEAESGDEPSVKEESESEATTFDEEDLIPSEESDDTETESSEGDLFDDDFSDAFAGADSGMGGFEMSDSGGEFGMGGSGDAFGVDDADGFDVGDAGGGFEEDEEFESDIPRISVGIEGLDSMVQGGVPRRSLMVVMGSAGTGKTTFGLQFINEALANGERAVFITLEETRERIISTADEKGWNFSEHVENDDLAIVDLDPVEMVNSLSSIRSELPRLIGDFGASRLVLDSVSLLELMYDDQATRRTEVYGFTKALKQAGVTTMVTSEASSNDPYTSRYGIIEYLTDAVFVLQYIRGEDFRETRLAVEIQKIRDANHSRETKPYEITNEGISVYRQANIF